MTIDHDEPVNASDSPQVSKVSSSSALATLDSPAFPTLTLLYCRYLTLVQAIQAAIMASISGARVIQPILLDAQVSISRSLLLLVSGSLNLRVSDQEGNASHAGDLNSWADLFLETQTPGTSEIYVWRACSARHLKCSTIIQSLFRETQE